MNTSTVSIQDKNGKYWNTLCATEFVSSEIRNMQRHLDAAAKHPNAYRFLDLATAIILVDGVPYQSTDDDISDNELLKALGLLENE